MPVLSCGHIFLSVIVVFYSNMSQLIKILILNIKVLLGFFTGSSRKGLYPPHNKDEKFRSDVYRSLQNISSLVMRD